MAFEDRGVGLAALGAVFIANAESAIPTGGVKQFDVGTAMVGEGPTGQWTNIGHLSAETLPEFNLEGGDATTRATWSNPQFRTIYDQVTGTVTLNSVQGDRQTLSLFFNGKIDTDGGVAFSLQKSEQKKALFILWKDSNTNERFAVYLPNTSLSFNSLPTLSNDNFVEYQVQGNILTSSSLPKDDNGRATGVKIYDAEAFDDSK